MFDIFDPSFLLSFFIEFDDDAQEKLLSNMMLQMKDLGYESHNAISNLGSVFVFGVLYLFQVIIFWFITLFGFKKFEKLRTYLNNKLFYGAILTIVLDAYLEFLISGVLNTKWPVDTKSGEIMGNVVGYISIFLTCLLMPCLFIWLLC